MTLHRFELAHDWDDMLNWAHAQQRAYPDWFTPDYAAGVAEANICELQTARKDLEKFLRETTDATSYASLHKRAQRLRNDLDAPGEAQLCPSTR